MAKVALIEAKPSRNNYEALFDGAFEFDKYSLTSDETVKKVLKANVDIDIDLDAYDWVILVGSEPLKMYTAATSITSYTGVLVDEKFLPVINPAMIRFKPEAEKPWLESKTKIINFVTGAVEAGYSEEDFLGIEDTDDALAYIQDAIDYDSPFIALDSETSALYPRQGYILGLSITYREDSGVYINADCIDEDVCSKLQELFNKKLVVFHNAKFDLAFFEYHFKFEFPRFADTMLLHYVLDETQGSHGLKELALKYTKYGDYESELVNWRKDYCRAYGIKQADFTYDVIPFDIMQPYACVDSCCTYALFNKFRPLVLKNTKLNWVYENLLIPGCRFLTDVQEFGVPFSMSRLQFAQGEMNGELEVAVAGLSKFPQIAEMEMAVGKPFNPNSTLQLRKLLFDYCGLKPTGVKTGTGADSVNAEVLTTLAEQHEIPKYILAIRKSGKIKSTYLDKIIPQLDSDSRLRTGFHLHTTTSGRLSSSGKLNLQQLPRDNPAVKGCIKAPKGYKIVSMDLTTAEMYIAAVESDDLELQAVFASGGNFHSSIAKKVFNLDCAVEDVAELYPLARQSSKAVSFGIMYQAGPAKIAESVNKEGGSMTVSQAKQVIADYFTTFWKLKEWIDNTKGFIEANAYIYSSFGRKRRLPNVRSDNRGVQGHEVRSGLNFCIQSVNI